MSISYVLGAEPIWYIVNNNGTPSGGATLTSYDALTGNAKPIYMNAEGAAWDNPIDFDLNGTSGPFYFAVDSANPNDGYFLVVKDAQGNPLWSVNNYLPAGGGGGGGGGTDYSQILNYITNGPMINHIGNTQITPAVSLPISLVVAPSNHKGFTPYTSVPIIGTYGALGPDIMFLKGSTVNQDNIQFMLFAFSSSPMAAGSSTDITPVDFLQYQCTSSNTGDVYKCFQFPITQKVKNLSNQKMTFKVWAMVSTGTQTLPVYLRQYYGSGTAATPESTSTLTLIGNCAVTTTWTAFYLNFTVPSVGLNSIGTLGSQTDDDAIYVQLGMPLDTAVIISFTKPALYLGTIQPPQDFNTYDQIDSVNSTARTGDVKTSYLSTAPLGWIAMNDGSIGNTGSAATIPAAKGAHAFALFKTIWDGVSNNTYAPVSGGRGSTALADFLANKTLTLPRALGRALAGAGSGSGLTPTTLGEWQGQETVLLTGVNLPSGTPFNSTGSGTALITPDGTYNVPASTSNAYSQGGNTAFFIIQPTTYFNVFIKL